MNWLITGGCGFIGVNLIKNLVEEGGHKIKVIDNHSVGQPSDLRKVCNFTTKQAHVPWKESDVELYNIDLLSDSLPEFIFEDIDVIVHLAALSGVRISVRNPKLSFTSNVIGSFELLETAREYGIRKFINASSGACVGDHAPPINETLLCKPISPYGATKLCVEALCNSYYHSFGIDTVSLRFSNVYGPLSNNKESLVAKFIKKMISGQIFDIYGDGKQTRDFIYTNDLVEAIKLSAITNSIGGEVFQLCTGEEKSVNEIIEILTTILINKGFPGSEIIYKHIES